MYTYGFARVDALSGQGSGIYFVPASDLVAVAAVDRLVHQHDHDDIGHVTLQADHAGAEAYVHDADQCVDAHGQVHAVLPLTSATPRVKK